MGLTVFVGIYDIYDVSFPLQHRCHFDFAWKLWMCRVASSRCRETQPTCNGRAKLLLAPLPRSADRRTWGLQPLIFIFNYRGNDMQSVRPTLCFVSGLEKVNTWQRGNCKQAMLHGVSSTGCVNLRRTSQSIDKAAPSIDVNLSVRTILLSPHHGLQSWTSGPSSQQRKTLATPTLPQAARGMCSYRLVLCSHSELACHIIKAE